MTTQKELRVSTELTISRSETWQWLTDSSRTAKWYGPYRQEGDRLFITMIHEEGQPTVEGRLLDYEEGRLLHLRAGEGVDGFAYQVALQEIPGGTRVTLTQPSISAEMDPWYEAGWRFYLDCLKHAVEGRPAPKFEDYAPQA